MPNFVSCSPMPASSLASWNRLRKRNPNLRMENKMADYVVTPLGVVIPKELLPNPYTDSRPYTDLYAYTGCMDPSLEMALAAAKAQNTFPMMLEGNLAQIQLGQIAQRLGSAGIRSFGKLLEETARNFVNCITFASLIELRPETQQQYDRMSRLRGAAFDKAFLKHVIEFHMRFIDALNELSFSGSRALAEEMLTSLRRHLAIAQFLAESRHKIVPLFLLH